MTEWSSQLQGALSDRYRIEREIGAGGMATVYLAHDLRHDRCEDDSLCKFWWTFRVAPEWRTIALSLRVSTRLCSQSFWQRDCLSSVGRYFCIRGSDGSAGIHHTGGFIPRRLSPEGDRQHLVLPGNDSRAQHVGIAWVGWDVPPFQVEISSLLGKSAA